MRLPSCLLHFLNPYLKNLDEVNLGLGNVVIENLELSEEFLRRAKQPIALKYGKIERVELVLESWYKLLSPAKIRVEGVDVRVKLLPRTQRPSREEIKTWKQQQITKLEAQLGEVWNQQEDENLISGELVGVQPLSAVEIFLLDRIRQASVEIVNVRIQIENEDESIKVGLNLNSVQLKSFNPFGENSLPERFFKEVKLNDFSLYFDTTVRQKYHDFVIPPVSIEAELKVNIRPQNNEKLLLGLKINFAKFPIALTRQQCHAGIKIINKFVANQKRKTLLANQKPPLKSPLSEPKQWWLYAIRCVIDLNRGYSVPKFNKFADVVAVVRNSKNYRLLYLTKLSGKLDSEGENTLESLEDELNPFVIVFQRSLAKRAIDQHKLSAKPESTSSWLSSIFNWRSQNWYSANLTEIESAISLEDRTHLLEQIGETRMKNLKAVSLNFDLSFQALEIVLKDGGEHLTRGYIQELFLFSNVQTNSSFSFKGRCSSAEIVGVEEHRLIKAPVNQSEAVSSFLLFDFISCEKQKLELFMEPLAFYFDTMSFTRLLEVFQSDISSELNELAVETAQEIKQRSVAFAKSLLRTKKKLELDVNIRGGFFVVPHGGKLKNSANLLVVDLGSLSLKSNEDELKPDIKRFSSDLEELRQHSYNKIMAEINHVQIFFDKSGEFWKDSVSFIHLVPPIYLDADFNMCMIEDDHLPKVIVGIHLNRSRHQQGITFDLNFKKLKQVFELISSLSSVEYSPVASNMAFLSQAIASTKSAIISEGKAISEFLEKSGSLKKYAELSCQFHALRLSLTDESQSLTFRADISNLDIYSNIDSQGASGRLSIESLVGEHERFNKPDWDSNSSLIKAGITEVVFDFPKETSRKSTHIVANILGSAAVTLQPSSLGDILEFSKQIKNIFSGEVEAGTPTTETFLTPLSNRSFVTMSISNSFNKSHTPVSKFFFEFNLPKLLVHLKSSKRFASVEVTSVGVTVAGSPIRTELMIKVSKVTGVSALSLHRFLQSDSSRDAVEFKCSILHRRRRVSTGVNTMSIVSTVAVFKVILLPRMLDEFAKFIIDVVKILSSKSSNNYSSFQTSSTPRYEVLLKIESPLLFVPRQSDLKGSTFLVISIGSVKVVNMNKGSEFDINSERFSVNITDGNLDTILESKCQFSPILDPTLISLGISTSRGPEVTVFLGQTQICFSQAVYKILLDTISWVLAVFKSLKFTSSKGVKRLVDIHPADNARSNESSILSIALPLAQKTFAFRINLDNLKVRCLFDESSQMLANFGPVEFELSCFKSGDLYLYAMLSDVELTDSDHRTILRNWNIVERGPQSRFLVFRSLIMGHSPSPPQIDVDFGNLIILFKPIFLRKVLSVFVVENNNENKAKPFSIAITAKIFVRMSRSRLVILPDGIMPMSELSLSSGFQFEFSSLFELNQTLNSVQGSVDIKSLSFLLGSFEKISSSPLLSHFQCVVKPLKFVRIQLVSSQQSDHTLWSVSGECGDTVISVTPTAAQLLINTIEQIYSALSGVPYPGAEKNRGDDGANYSIAPDTFELEKHYPASKLKFNFLKPLDQSVNRPQSKTTITNDSNEHGHQLEISVYIRSVSIKLTTTPIRNSPVIPLVQLRSAVDLKLELKKDSEFNIRTYLDVEIAYYNRLKGVWEPLLEPVECNHPSLQRPLASSKLHRRSRVAMLIWKNANDRSGQVTISIEANEMLEVVATKTGISVLTETISSFMNMFGALPTNLLFDEAMKGVGVGSRPIRFCNRTSHVYFTIKADEGWKFAEIDKTRQQISKDFSYITVEPGQTTTADLVAIPGFLTIGRTSTPTRRQGAKSEKSEKLMVGSDLKTLHKFQVEVEETHEKTEISVSAATESQFYIGSKRFISKASGIDDGTLIVQLMTPVEIINHTQVDLKISPDGVSWHNLPSKSNIFIEHYKGRFVSFKPSDDELAKGSLAKYQVVPNAKRSLVSFSADSKEPLNLVVQLEHNKVINEFTVHIASRSIFQNFLPVSVAFSLLGLNRSREVKPGGQLDLCRSPIDGTEVLIEISNYLGKSWVTKRASTFYSFKGSKSISFFHKSGESGALRLAVFSSLDTATGSTLISLYTPYWFINRTGLPLAYKVAGGVYSHPNFELDSPVLICLPSAFTSDNASEQAVFRVKVDQVSGWSGKLSLDAAGIVVTAICHSADEADGDSSDSDFDTVKASKFCCTSSTAFSGTPKSYCIRTAVSISTFRLTKIITLTPYFNLINKCQFPISCHEKISSFKMKMYQVPPNSVVPFWPHGSGSKRPPLFVHSDLTHKTSRALVYTKRGSVLVPFPNSQFRGINVATSIFDGSMEISFEPYLDRMAPLLLINGTSKISIQYFQEQSLPSILDPGNAALYCWSRPDLDKVFKWLPVVDNFEPVTVDFNTKFENDSFVVNGTECHWVLFTKRHQKILLFTDNESIVAKIGEAQGVFDHKFLEIQFKLSAVGLSIIDDIQNVEIAYSAILPLCCWEHETTEGRWKSFKDKHISTLEDAHQSVECGKPVDTVQLSKNTKVNLGEMKRIRYDRDVTPVRRLRQDGMWASVGFSKSRYHIHLKVNNIQIDNQIFGSPFPTALTPRMTVADKLRKLANGIEVKPFFEVSSIICQQPGSQTLVYEYVKVLVQELDLRMDLIFISHLFRFFVSDSVGDSQDGNNFELNLTNNEVDGTQVGTRHFFEILHISPLKVLLSFSSAHLEQNSDQELLSEVLDFALSSLGLLTGDVRDAIFKLACYERLSTFMTWHQFMDEIYRHYFQQGLKQFYSVILGLDVFGNPSKIVRDLASGVEELFYEPIQGAVLGPDEMVVSLGRGLRNFAGQLTGTISGGLGKMTTTVGRAAVKLTFDQDFQVARRLERQHLLRTESSRVRFLIGLSSLYNSVRDGVTGVVKKPLQGYKDDGAPGFFKGLAVGGVGVVLRPTIGVIDLASISFFTVQRLTNRVKMLRRLRPQRWIDVESGGFVKPYVYCQAQARWILLLATKTLKASEAFADQRYSTHLVLKNEVNRGRKNREILVATQQGLFHIRQSALLNKWQIDFHCLWQETTGQPKFHVTPNNRIVIAFDLRSGRTVTFTAVDTPDNSMIEVSKEFLENISASIPP